MLNLLWPFPSNRQVIGKEPFRMDLWGKPNRSAHAMVTTEIIPDMCAFIVG
jgi:hypothetical protein